MSKQNVRLLLLRWAKWKCGVVEYETAYRSPPNMIYRLMAGDVGGGSAGGSQMPYAFRKGGAVRWCADMMYRQINDVIEQLPRRRREAVYLEFLETGTQKDKAARMGVGLRAYEKNLNSAFKQIYSHQLIKNLVKAA
ncbi:hypothetical protein [Conchiformibius kuhniae]|uniref:RNA polymerase sigma factor 70 region 4 type 2 domain-containing protein n=1 Tax=Conchiformibius kuhniae TaxID=211502 RepID=A0A8T9MWU8_9NEIS|nr:hypothetical protein [Conchiformibius kuhniae]